MKKVLRKNKGGVIFYSVIILMIICVNSRYKYLNNLDTKDGSLIIYNEK